MSKNTLKKYQQRREEGGREESGSTDDLRDALLDAEAKNKQPTKRLNAEIPSGLHDRFKAACQAEGKSMTNVVTQLVETYVELKEWVSLYSKNFPLSTRCSIALMMRKDPLKKGV